MDPRARRAVRDLLVGADEIGLAQSGPQRQVAVLIEGVEVGADGAAEQRRVLGDDAEAGAQVREADGRDVQAVDRDAAAGELGEAE